MAFTSELIKRPAPIAGGLKESRGRYRNTSGSTGGDVNTGLRRCESFVITPATTAIVDSQSVVNEDIENGPVDGSAVTIVTGSNENGTWIAKGV